MRTKRDHHNLFEQRFGLLVAVKPLRPRPPRGMLWECKCECGNIVEKPSTLLHAGNILSCGRKCPLAYDRFKHHLARHPLYRIWNNMVRRCDNPKERAYPQYGGRGIVVCDRWKNVTNFVSDILSNIGERPSLSHTLDRINNDGNYEPTNVKWSTRSEQQRNKSTTKLYTFNGRSQTMAAWCQEFGIPMYVASHRIRRGGWPPERAMTTPVRTYPRHN